MTKIEYLKYSIENNLFLNNKWFYTFFTILEAGTTNEYCTYTDNTFNVIVNGEYVKITDYGNKNVPLFTMSDVLTVDTDMIGSCKTPTESTIGILMANVLLLYIPFGVLFEYINGKFNIGKITDAIAKYLNSNKITVKQYLSFVDSCSYLESLSRITTVSATRKGMLPPPNIKQKKSELNKQLIEKYGKDWHNNSQAILEYDIALKKYDDDWLKDDPGYDKIISGKMKDNARSRMYLMFGNEAGFDTSGKPHLIDNSLIDGYPKDVKQLKVMFDTSRSGSYDRGTETQKGGAVAKDILRAVSGVVIEDGDCGSKATYEILVTEDNVNSIIGRNMIVNGKLVKIEDEKSILGKIINIRTPLYCNKKGNTYCSTCVGDTLAQFKTGVNLMVTEISGAILSISLKSMHTAKISHMSFDINEAIV